MAVRIAVPATMTPMQPMMMVAVNMLLGAVIAVEALLEATVIVMEM